MQSGRYVATLELPDGSRRAIEVERGEPVLAAARRHGIDLPSRCEQGWDGVCAMAVVAGRVDHSRALRYYPQDAVAGYVLPCVARLRSDALLRTHQAEALRRHRDARGLPTPRAVV